jgi:hypothetical protein
MELLIFSHEKIRANKLFTLGPVTQEHVPEGVPDSLIFVRAEHIKDFVCEEVQNVVFHLTVKLAINVEQEVVDDVRNTLDLESATIVSNRQDGLLKPGKLHESFFCYTVLALCD